MKKLSIIPILILLCICCRTKENKIENQRYKTPVLQKTEVLADKTESGCRVCETPQVSNLKLFEAILSRYKGKVVFVDFWATWCKPCQMAIRKMESLKESDLKGKDIVYVYLTVESSSLNIWTDIVQNTKGEHYWLNKEQWSYVCRLFGITHLPAYVIADKTGEYSRIQNMHDPDGLKTVLLQEAAK